LRRIVEAAPHHGITTLMVFAFASFRRHKRAAGILQAAA
jgi:hypothetical protein